MPHTLFSYRQSVSRYGYGWVLSEYEGIARWARPPENWFDLDWFYGHSQAPEKPDPSSGYYLAALADGSRERAGIEKDIGDYPTLFLELADVPLTADGIVEFANKWGFLNDRFGMRECLRVPSDDGNQALVYGEPIYSWVFAVVMMSRLCQLWELIRNKDEQGLAGYVRWTGDSLVRFGEYVVASRDFAPERLKSMKSGDLLEPARYYIEDGVSRFNLGGAQPNLRTDLLWDHRLGEWRIQPTPDNMVGALWFQFANAVCDNSGFRRCRECGRWLQLGPGSGRPEKTYCSDACRMRAYRKRKAGGGS